jgi:nuclease S1
MRLLLAATLLLAALPVAAWSGPGHELVAQLAEAQLRPQTRAAALALLQEEGHDSLAEVARWADVVRDEPAYRWSAPLHFVNLSRGDCRYEPARHCRRGECVVAAVERFRATLADGTRPVAERREALKFLVHFVGDIHQPLHAGHAHDKGGNTFQVNLDGEGSNLHRIWDYHLLASSGRSPAEHLVALSAEPLPAAGAGDPAAWAMESCRIVLQDGFYPARRRLPHSYLEQWRPVAEARVRLAAARLAATLEAAIGTDRPRP